MTAVHRGQLIVKHAQHPIWLPAHTVPRDVSLNLGDYVQKGQQLVDLDKSQILSAIKTLKKDMILLEKKQQCLMREAVPSLLSTGVPNVPFAAGMPMGMSEPNTEHAPDLDVIILQAECALFNQRHTQRVQSLELLQDRIKHKIATQEHTLKDYAKLKTNSFHQDIAKRKRLMMLHRQGTELQLQQQALQVKITKTITQHQTEKTKLLRHINSSLHKTSQSLRYFEKIERQPFLAAEVAGWVSAIHPFDTSGPATADHMLFQISREGTFTLKGWVDIPQPHASSIAQGDTISIDIPEISENQGGQCANVQNVTALPNQAKHVYRVEFEVCTDSIKNIIAAKLKPMKPVTNVGVTLSLPHQTFADLVQNFITRGDILRKH